MDISEMHPTLFGKWDYDYKGKVNMDISEMHPTLFGKRDYDYKGKVNMDISEMHPTLFGKRDYDYKINDIVVYNLSNDETYSNHTRDEDDIFHGISDFFQVLLIMLFIFYSITFILGIPGNALVIWIAGFKMKTVSAVWFLNLAIADFICCVILPLKIAHWALLFQGYFFSNLCKVGAGVLYITMCASVNFLTAMSIDRCLSIMWPFWSKIYRTPKCARITSVIIWGFSLILSVPHVFSTNKYYEISECNGKYFNAFTYNMQITRFVTMFVIPFTIILVCYCLIFFKLIKVRRPNKSQRPYRIITAVVTCFFICWFPYYTWPLIPLPKKYWKIDDEVYHICVCLAYFNSCINPILYVFIGQDFKDSLMHSIPSRLERALNDISNQSSKERDNLNAVVSNGDV